MPQVDPVLDIIWPESPVATCPEDYFSVHWHGYLLSGALKVGHVQILVKVSGGYRRLFLL